MSFKTFIHFTSFLYMKKSLSLRQKCVTRCLSASCAFCVKNAGRLTDGFC